MYGTLRSDGAAFVRIARHVTSISAAVLDDHALHGHGLPYPFAVEDHGWRVVGEVMTVAPGSWASLSARLDEYEGDEYERVLVDVQVAGESTPAHVYRARHGLSFAPETRIASGDWMDRDSESGRP